MKTQDTILEKAVELYAQHGYEEFSIRKLAKRIPISHSVLYHYYEDEADILRNMFEYANRTLGRLRAELSEKKSAKEMLQQRIAFQIEHSDLIVAVLKYYLSHRPQFKKNRKGFVPDKSALHIEEVLKKGVATKEFRVYDLEDDAKVITHAINGFLLEYYPHKPTGREKKLLIRRIYQFVARALKGGEK